MNVSNITQERFLEAKKKVTRKYNEASTRMDSFGKYFVVTKGGRDICNLPIGVALDNYKFNQTPHCDTDDELRSFNSTLNKIPLIPHSNSVKEAWLKAEVAIKSIHIVDRNSTKFNDEKAQKEAIKDFE
jgi:phosphopantetheinyl transferase (holo-ACP synthase)|tara:strand:+ start:1438 stop:1824 length:387 start_codon:yes stop_codon:yes gene_type:complete